MNEGRDAPVCPLPRAGEEIRGEYFPRQDTSIENAREHVPCDSSVAGTRDEEGVRLGLELLLKEGEDFQRWQDADLMEERGRHRDAGKRDRMNGGRSESRSFSQQMPYQGRPVASLVNAEASPGNPATQV